MIGLLIIAYEAIGEAYQGLARHSFPNGFPENVRILGAQPNEDQNDIVDNIITALQEFPNNRGVLIMTDILGATPCNVTRRLICESKPAILTGLDAPMMVRAIQYSSQAEDLSDFTETVKEATIRGIFTIISAPEDLVYKENG